jgi:hypothetical protein
MLSRRRLLLSSLPLTLAAALPRRARASTGDRRFLFIWNDGGWDPLCFSAALFDSQTSDMQRGAQPMRFDGLTLVDHAERPSVRAFFESYASQVAVVNGISVPSVSHDICALLTMTGGSGGERPDWPTLLAEAAWDRYTLPSVVVGGPSFTGDLGTITSRVGAGGQLQGLIDGTCLDLGDELPSLGLTASTRARVDALVATAAGRRAASGEARAVDLRDSLARAAELSARSGEIDLGGFSDFPGQLEVAVQALSLGLSRCVTVSSGDFKLYWDSHANNDAIQSPALESLFSALSSLVARLSTTPSPSGGMLIDDTVVVGQVQARQVQCQFKLKL